MNFDKTSQRVSVTTLFQSQNAMINYNAIQCKMYFNFDYEDKISCNQCITGLSQ